MGYQSLEASLKLTDEQKQKMEPGGKKEKRGEKEEKK